MQHTHIFVQTKIIYQVHKKNTHPVRIKHSPVSPSQQADRQENACVCVCVCV